MRFQHPEYLAGLPAIILLALLFIFILRWKKITIKRIGDARLVIKLMQNHSPLKFFIKFLIVVIAFAAIVVGAANPQQPGKSENVNRTGVDVMVVLDVSKSMLATDIKPNRLEKSKQLLAKLLDKLQNDRIGIVVFAGRAYMQMPLTIDHGAAKMYIQDSGPEVVPTQGTVIADALQMANAAFNIKEKKYKTILLISDGEDHDPNAAKVAQTLAQNGVVINTVGVGSPEGTTIIDPETKEIKKDAQGQTVISKLNEAELQQLSTATNGIYLRLDNMDDALITLSQQIDSIEKKSLSDSEFIDYNSYFQYLLAAALLLLLTEFILPERKKLTRDLGRLA
jgi:Ca-activated chloride channel family protein